MFNPKCVERFNTLCKETGANVILSSSWRVCFPLPVMWEVLEKNGVLHLPIATTTKQHMPRGMQILRWVNNNPQNIKVDSFVALDDFFMPELTDRQVLTDFDFGLSNSDIKKAKIILEQPWKSPS